MGVPWGRPTGLSSATWLTVPIATVTLGNLIAMQPTVSLAALMDPELNRVSLDPFPHVVIYSGEYYLEDGHHRAVNALLDGKTYIRARVLKWVDAL